MGPNGGFAAICRIGFIHCHAKPYSRNYLFLGGGRGTARRAPTSGRFGHPIPCSLPTIIGAFKSACTRRINEMEKTTGVLWQRNYYEHIIRNESELNRVREYIADNPARWGEDIYNPDYGDKKCPR